LSWTDDHVIATADKIANALRIGRIK